MTYHVCHDGQWSRQPGEKRCTCPPATPLEGPSGVVQERDEDKDGKILCWPPQNTQASMSKLAQLHACKNGMRIVGQMSTKFWPGLIESSSGSGILTLTPFS